MKMLIPLQEDEVAPRFDLAGEVMVASCSDGEPEAEPRTILLPGPSADELCALALREGVDTVICNGIEENHYQYLRWKKIEVIDGVIGNIREVLRLAAGKKLTPGAIVKAPPQDAGAAGR